MQFIFNCFLLVVAGILLLRIAGRKSISQMTLAQTVIMISIGSIIIQPIIETSVVRTLIATTLFVLTLIIVEWLQLKFNVIEKLVTGKSKILIENGQLQTQQLKKHRITVDQLEMFIRQQGINQLSDIKTATLEPNGQLGYELKEDARPLTIGEFKKMMNPSMLNSSYLPIYPNNDNQKQQDQLFDELKYQNNSKHDDYLH
nr:YetF domain-containing protein [Aquibacillus albus]